MYRAKILIAGSTVQFVYGKNQDRLMARAVKLLTVFAPGTGNLYPKAVELEKNVGYISGNRSLWEHVFTLRYQDVPEDQHEWRKIDALRKSKEK